MDKNKHIREISYNRLNLPYRVYVSTPTGSLLQPLGEKEDVSMYVYDALGTKLKSTYSTSKGYSMVIYSEIDYCGNYIYENDTLSKVLLPEGYISIDKSNVARYHYYLKDHQGNNRVVLSQSNVAEQVNHYYPFGALFGMSKNGNVQKYKFGGKELERVAGVDLYDFEARQYDAVLGRYTSMDPMCESYYSVSPYAYCNNNPINRIDPSGMLDSPIYDQYGDLLGTDDEGLQGNPFFMDKRDFRQGMPHDVAMMINQGYKFLEDSRARSNFVTSYSGLSSRPDYDGKLTLSEANNWYKNGGGKSLYVDASKIDLFPFYIEDFRVNIGEYKNFAGYKTPNIETGLVYGTIYLTLLDNEGNVRIGNKNNYVDKYDFDQKPGAPFFRNAATRIGEVVAGRGTSYNMWGYGLGKLKHKPLKK